MGVSVQTSWRLGKPRRVAFAIARVRAAAAWSYATVFATYGVLVLLLWVPFGPRNGMPYETGFPYLSETRSWFDGFFFPSDDLRPYTTVFYHLGYLIGEATGHAGSFVPYQLVYAGLWLGRGVLVFLILAAFLGRSSVVAYLGGVLTLVHAADHALNWVGQMNQFGMIFWMLLSIWLLVRGMLTSDWLLSIPWLFGALVAERMCLWSYESPLFIMLLVPVLLLVVFRSFRTRERIVLLGTYYIVPLVYCALSLNRYRTGGSTYQASVVRDDISLQQLFSDLVFNIRTSVAFWNWPDGFPAANDQTAYIVGLAAAAGVIVGGLLACWPRAGEVSLGRRPLTALAAVGAVLLVASFPAYLILTSSRLVWRTQFLSGIGFGITLAALLVLVARLLPERRARLAAALLGAGVVAFFGASSSYRIADFHYGIWQRHKNAIEEVLEVAPHVKPDTVIVYTGVPANADPFGDTMWFDVALRLAYPHTPVSGVYYRQGGQTPPGQGLALRRGYWEKTGVGFPPLLQHVPLEHTIFIAYNTGDGHKLDRVPPFLASAASPARYLPSSVLDGRPPDKRALRRYGPLDAPEETNAR